MACKYLKKKRMQGDNRSNFKNLKRIAEYRYK